MSRHLPSTAPLGVVPLLISPRHSPFAWSQAPSPHLVWLPLPFVPTAPFRRLRLPDSVWGCARTGMLAGDPALGALRGGRGGAGLARPLLLLTPSHRIRSSTCPRRCLSSACMLAGDPTLGAVGGGRGGAELVSTGSEDMAIARLRAPQRQPQKLKDTT